MILHNLSGIIKYIITWDIPAFKEIHFFQMKFIYSQTFSMHSTNGIIINIRQEKKKTNNYYHELYSNIVNIYLSTNIVII